MSHTIDIFPRARADIRSKIAWLSERSTASASRWHARLRSKIRSLAENPERCPLADEADDLGIELRQLLHGRRPHVYRILFVIQQNTVCILRIRHASQDRLAEDDL